MEFGTFRRTTRGRSNADFTGLTLHLEPSPLLRSHISQPCTDSGLWSLAAVLRTRAVCRVARFWGVTVCSFVDSFRSAGGSKLDPCSSSAVTKPISNGLLRPTRQTPAPCCILLHGSENRQNGYAKPEFENAFSARLQYANNKKKRAKTKYDVSNQKVYRTTGNMCNYKSCFRYRKCIAIFSIESCTNCRE